MRQFETLTVIVVSVTLFPQSIAWTLMVWLPFGTLALFHVRVHGAAESYPRYVPSTQKRTFCSPCVSDALASIVIVPLTVAPFAGEAMLTVGGVLSGLMMVITIVRIVLLPA